MDKFKWKAGIDNEDSVIIQRILKFVRHQAYGKNTESV